MKTTLTKKEKMMIPKIRDKWLTLVLDHPKLDRKKTTEAYIFLYSIPTKQNPRVWIMDSPIACQVLANLLNLVNIGDNIRVNIRDNLWADIGDNIGANIGDNLWDNLWANIWANIRANIRDNIWANIRDNIWANIRDNLWADIGDNIGANIGDNLWDNLWANIWDNIGDNIRDNIGANKYYFFGYRGSLYDFSWIAFYDYFVQIDQLTHYEFIEYCQHAKHFGMFNICFESDCIVSEYPIFLTRDPQNRLHNIDQAAVQWKDGFKMYFVHGVFFTPKEFERYILNTPSYIELNQIPNVEKRTAVLMEKMQLILQSDPSIHLIAKDTEKTHIPGERPKILYRELYSFQYLGEERRAVLLYCHSVEKPNIHLVPISCQTPAEAVAWMNYGITDFEVQT